MKKPAIRQEDDGKRLMFECLIKADPLPQVRWSHNDEPVNDDARHKVDFYTSSAVLNKKNFDFSFKKFQLSITKDGQQYFAALEIKNVTVEDAGKYKVTAKNELGESNATITLNFDSKQIYFYSFKHTKIIKQKNKKWNLLRFLKSHTLESFK